MGILTCVAGNLFWGRAAFRSMAIRYGLRGYRDAQFELVDGLLPDRRVGCFAELALSPHFQRGWGSASAAVELGEQVRESLRSAFCAQVASSGVQVFVAGATVWPHSGARTLAGLVYEHSGALPDHPAGAEPSSANRPSSELKKPLPDQYQPYRPGHQRCEREIETERSRRRWHDHQ